MLTFFSSAIGDMVYEMVHSDIDAASSVGGAAPSPTSSIVTHSSVTTTGPDPSAFNISGTSGMGRGGGGVGALELDLTGGEGGVASTCYYGCPRCNFVFLEQTDLEAHIAETHADEAAASGIMPTQVTIILFGY